MSINTGLNLKTRFFLEKKKRINVIYFGSMFFEVQARIFV